MANVNRKKNLLTDTYDKSLRLKILYKEPLFLIETTGGTDMKAEDAMYDVYEDIEEIEEVEEISDLNTEYLDEFGGAENRIQYDEIFGYKITKIKFIFAVSGLCMNGSLALRNMLVHKNVTDSVQLDTKKIAAMVNSYDTTREVKTVITIPQMKSHLEKKVSRPDHKHIDSTTLLFHADTEFSHLLCRFLYGMSYKNVAEIQNEYLALYADSNITLTELRPDEINSTESEETIDIYFYL
jgi:hypothetical protein